MIKDKLKKNLLTYLDHNTFIEHKKDHNIYILRLKKKRDGACKMRNDLTIILWILRKEISPYTEERNFL